MQRYPQHSLAHPGRTLLIWLAVIGLGGFAMAAIPQLELNPTFRSMIMDDDPDRAADRRAKQIFGDDELITLAIEDPQGVFNIPTLTLIDRLTAELEKLAGVREVYSLTRVDNIRGQDGMLLTDDLITDLPTTPEDVQRIERDAFENPMYVKNVVAPDKKVAGINVELALDSTSKDHERITKAVYEIVEQASKTKPAGVNIYVTGYPVASYTGGIYMLLDMVMFGGAAMMVLMIVMWLVFRCWQGVVATMLVVMSSITVSYGLMAVLGVPVSMPLSAVMVFLTALGMQYSTYVGFAHREQTHRERGYSRPAPRDPRFVLSEAMRGVRGSVVMSAITTAIGFGSMYMNRVPDLKTMGLFLVVGLVTTSIAVMTIVPAVMARWPFEIPPGNRQHRRLQALIDRVGETAVTSPRTMLGIAACLCAGGIFGFTQLDTNTDGMQYFKRSSEIRQAEEFVRARMAGTTYLQAVVSTAQVDSFKHPENLRKLVAIQEYAETLPHVTKTVSHADHLRLMNRALRDGSAAEYKLPETKEAVEQYLLLHNDPDDFRLMIDSDYRNANVMIRMNTMSSAVQRVTEQKLEAFMRQQFPDAEVNLVGTNLLTHRAFDEMATSMLKSLGFATILIWLVMIIGLRSIRLGTLALVPNLVPSILIYSILPLIGQPLDPPTAVTGAVALGILADDTIHFFRTWIAKRREVGSDAMTAVTKTLSEIGKPMVLSSIIVAVGFSIMWLSRYGTLVWTGIMMVIVTTTALVWELVCTPAMLRLLGGRPRKAKAVDVSPAMVAKAATVTADVKRPALARYSADEIAALPTTDFLAIAGKTVLSSGGSSGTRRLLVELGVEPHQRILVLGVGVGETALTIAAQDPTVRVTGCDASAFMVETSRKRVAEHHPLARERVEIVHSPKPDVLPFDADAFDVVVVEAAAAAGDPSRLFREVSRVLKAGGRVGVHEWCWLEAPSAELETAAAVIGLGGKPGDMKFFTQAGWERSLTGQGFEIGFAEQYPATAFTWTSMRDDEGTLACFKIFGSVIAKRAAARRLAEMRRFVARQDGVLGFTVTTAHKPRIATVIADLDASGPGAEPTPSA